MKKPPICLPVGSWCPISFSLSLTLAEVFSWTKRQAEASNTEAPQLICITDESHSFTVRRPGRHGDCSLPAIHVSDNPGLTARDGHEPKVNLLVKGVITRSYFFGE